MDVECVGSAALARVEEVVVVDGDGALALPGSGSSESTSKDV